MSYSELVQVCFESSSALQCYWSLYVIVIGGLLAFSSIRKERDRATTVLISLRFCFFANKNHGAIQDVTLQRQATLEGLAITAPAITPAARRLDPTMRSTDPAGLRNVHLLSDLVTLAALWSMELRRKRAERKAS